MRRLSGRRAAAVAAAVVAAALASAAAHGAGQHAGAHSAVVSGSDQRRAQAAAAAASAHRHAPADTAERRALMDAGEARLAANDTDGALQAFDRAAALVHAADAELALVRTHMQAGEYRRALNFAPHAAAAHRDWPAAAVLYAWLLALGGQDVVASRTIDEALRIAPGDPALLRAQAELGSLASADALSAAASLRLRPYATPGNLVPADAVAAGSAVLVGAGGQQPPDAVHAVVQARAVAGARGVWLRNGMGQTVAASIERADAASGLVLLRLASALPSPAGLQRSPREPFAGSPATMVGYSLTSGIEPAWPVLRSGFFGRMRGPAGPSAAPSATLRDLGIDAPPHAHGGPVFDAGGRLAGLAVAGDDGSPRLVSCETLAERVGAPLPPPAGAAGSAAERVPADAVYERALRLALQVMVLR